jgi:hypothetical protein
MERLQLFFSPLSKIVVCEDGLERGDGGNDETDFTILANHIYSSRKQAQILVVHLVLNGMSETFLRQNATIVIF